MKSFAAAGAVNYRYLSGPFTLKISQSVRNARKKERTRIKNRQKWMKRLFEASFFICIKSINYILKNKPGSNTARPSIYRFSKLPT